MCFRKDSPCVSRTPFHITLHREASLRPIPYSFPMEELIRQEGLDRNNITRSGILTKKDVFRWTVAEFHPPKPKSIIRSNYFEFGPTPCSKYFLVCNIYDLNSNYFTVGLRRYLLGKTRKDIRIKVSFSLLDNRDRSHHPSEKYMTANLEYVQASFDRSTYTTHNSMFLCNNTLRFQCSMDVDEVMDEKQAGLFPHMSGISISEEPAQDLASNLRSLLESGLHSDVVLNLTGQEFKVHRSILAARSSVFAAMFEHNTVEKQNNRVDIVDVPSDTMGHLLRYLYTGETGGLSTQEFISLFVAADKYNVPKLKTQCSGSISPNITSGTALCVLTLAHLHHDDQLQQAAVNVILDNALKVMKSEEWLIFLKEYSVLANSIILKLALRSQPE